MSLADRRKRNENRSSNRRESIDSFVSYRNSQYDEEERKKREAASPLSDENKSAAAKAVDRYVNLTGNTNPLDLTYDPLKSSAKYLYTDAAVKKSAPTIDALAGKGTASSMRASLAANEIGKRAEARLREQKASIRRQFSSDEEYNDYVEGQSIGWTSGKFDPENAGKRAERKSRKEARIAEINKELEEIDRAVYDPSYSGYLSNDELTDFDDKRKALTSEKEALEADINKYVRLQEPLDKYAAEVGDLTAQADKYKQFVKNYSEGSTYKGIESGASGGRKFDLDEVSKARGGKIGAPGTYGNPMTAGTPGLQRAEQMRKEEVTEAHPEYKQLTEDELNVFYGLLATDEKRAYAWLDSMSDILGKRRLGAYETALEEANTLEKVLEVAATTPMRHSMGAGLEDIANVASGKGKRPYTGFNLVNQEAQATIASASAGLDKDIPISFLNQTPGKTLQAIVSGLDSFVDMMALGHVGEVGMALRAGNAEGNKLWEKGADTGTIISREVLSGAFEALFEHLSIEMFFKNFMDAPITSPWDLVKKIGVQVLTEASEETATDGANFVSDLIHMRSQSEWAEMFNKYKAQGMTDGNAIANALTDEALNLWDSAVGGAIGALVNAGGGAVMSYAGAAKTGQQVSGQAQNIVDFANELEGGQYDKAVKKAAKITAKSPSNVQTGFLTQAVEQNIETIEDAEKKAEAKAAYSAALAPKQYSLDNATVAQTRQSVEISKENPIAKIDGDKIWLNTSGGVMQSTELDFNDDIARAVVNSMSDMDVTEANVILRNYTGGDVAAYVAGMKQGIFYGEYGTRENMTAFDTLNKAQQKIAVELGRANRAENIKQSQTAKVGQFTPAADETNVRTFKRRGAFGTYGQVYQKGEIGDVQNKKVNNKLINFVSDVTGYTIVKYDSRYVNDEDLKNANGKYVYKNDAIYVDMAAGNTTAKGLVAFALSHEVTHSAEKWASKEYQQYAEWLVKTYDKNGMSLRQLVKDYASKKGVSEKVALSEIVAESSEKLINDPELFKTLESMREESPTLWEKVVKTIEGLFNKLVNAYKGLEPESFAYGITRDFFSEEDLKEQRDKWRNLMVAAAQNRTEAVNKMTAVEKAVADIGINIDTATESANPDMFSLKTWNASDYRQNVAVAAAELAKKLGVSEKTARKYINDINSIAKIIADDQERLDFDAAEGLSSFVSNSEYGGSIDFSTICKKRRLMTGTFAAIQDRLGNEYLTIDDYLTIRKMMKDRGLEVSCGLCYVEGSRAKMGEFAAQFRELYQKHNPGAEWIPTQSDCVNPDKVEKMRTAHPDVYEQYVHFWNNKGRLTKTDPVLFATQNKPKLFQADTEYNGEILKSFSKDSTVEEKNKNGGLRIQSFSDFEIIHLLDAMQVITDMSRVGLAGQAYTKVPDFAWALGKTGLKINLSLIAKGVDENGRIILDEVEGMKRADAEKLRNAYSDNVGTILVAFNDEQLMAALNDPFIDFIIPFHRSQWASKYYDIMGLPKNTKDYTNYQSEKLLRQTYHMWRGKMVADESENFMPNEYWDFTKTGKENAEEYLRLCAAANKKPKFSNLLVNNGDGSYSLQPDGSTDGYWKLLIDFKMYNNKGVGVPQSAVKPTFNLKESQRMLDEYEGGHRGYPVAQDVVDDYLKQRGNEDIRYSRKVAGETVYNNRVILNEDTVDKYLRMYASKYTAKYAQAYITYIDPDTFIRLTTATAEGRQFIEDQTSDLDTEKLANASTAQPMFLDIDHTTGKVEQHEGRHRMNALRRAGVNKVPVLLFDFSNKYDKVTIPSLTLYGQDGWGGRANYAYATVYDVMPLSYENRDEIVKRFSEKTTTERLQEKYNSRETVQYSRKSSEDYSTRGIVERALKTLDKASVEYRTLSEYKKALDSLDAEKLALNEARRAGDKTLMTQAKNRINILNDQLARMESNKNLRNVAGIKDVVKLNDDIKELQDKMKAEARVTNGEVAKQKSVEAAASELMKRFGLRRGKAELAGYLSDFYTSMVKEVNRESLNREYMEDLARPIAEWLIDNRPEVKVENPEVTKVLDALKGQRIRVNENQKGDIKSRYDGDFNKWRRSLMGYVTVTNDPTAMTLDQLWQNLSEDYPQYFEQGISDADQGVRLADALAQLKADRYVSDSEAGQYDPEAAYRYDISTATQEIMDAFWNIQPYETIADRYQKQIDDLKAKHRERLKEERKGLRETIWEAKKESYQLAKDRARQQRERTELRRKIRNLTENMSARLVKPRANQYVPIELKNAVAKVLSAVDTDTGRSEKITEHLNALKAQYNEIQENRKFGDVYDAEVEALIDEAIKSADVPVREMNNDQLTTLYRALRAFDHAVREQSKMRDVNVRGTDLTVDAVRAAWMNEIANESKNTRGNIVEAIQQMVTNPWSYFETLAGFKKDSMSMKIYRLLNNAQLKMNGIRMAGNEFLSEFLNDEKYLKSITDTDNLIDIGLKDEDGNPIKMTKDFAFAIYIGLLNEDYALHMAPSGGTMPSMDDYYKNKDNAYTRHGTRYYGAIGDELTAVKEEIDDKVAKLKQQREDARTAGDFDLVDAINKQIDAEWSKWDAVIDKGFREMSKIRDNIESQMSEKDKAYVARMQEFFDVFSKNLMNETSMERLGFEIADVKNYLPIITDPNFRSDSVANQVKAMTDPSNKGFTKRRLQAKNPLTFAPLSDIAKNHLRNLSVYSAYAVPIYDMNRLLTGHTGGYKYDGSLRDMITKRFGKEGLDYLERLLVNVQGGSFGDIKSTRFDNLIEKGRGKFAQAALNGNIAVALVQTASMFTAVSELGWGPVMKAYSRFFGKSPSATISENSPLYWLRSTDEMSALIENVRSVKDRTKFQKLIHPMSSIIQFFDNRTVGMLWYASEYKVQNDIKKQHLNVKVGSEEYNQMVTDTFNDVVEKTQPNYTAMQRSEMLRSNNPVIRILAMFKTQRHQNLNILYQATERFKKYSSDLKAGKNGVTKEDVAGARKTMVDAWSSQIASAAFIALINFAIKGLLFRKPDKYKDEETGEFTLASVMKGLAEGTLDAFTGNSTLAGLTYNFVSSLITGKKFYSNISFGYMETISDAIETAADTGRKIIENDWTWDKAISQLEKVAGDVANTCGVPFRNVMNLLKGIAGHVVDISKGEFMRYGLDPTNAQVEERMYRAAMDGNKEEYDAAEYLLAGESESGADQKEATDKYKQYVHKLYKDKKISATDQAKALEWVGGETYTNALYTANRTGEMTDEETDAALKEMGMDQFEIDKLKESWEKKDVTNREDELYEEWEKGEISFNEAVDILKNEGVDLDEREQFNLEGEWESKKETGKNDFAEYDELKAAFTSYVSGTDKTQGTKDLKAAVKKYKDMGYPSTGLTSALGNTYRDRYKAADKSQRDAMRGYIINAYIECRKGDKDSKGHVYTDDELRKAAIKLVDGWLD